MDFKPIAMEDKKLFDDFFRRFPPQLSEFAFPNLFLWRHKRKTEFAILENHLIISIIADNQRKFYRPIGENPSKIIEKLFELFPDASFERIEKHIAEKLKDKFLVEEARDTADYVYSTGDMVKLAGRKYEPKRNLIKQCLEYNPKTCLLDDDTVHHFIEVQEKWCSYRNCDENPAIKFEDMAIKDALKYYKELNLFGICVWIDDEIEAFAIGEPLNKNTFVEHFEKANTKFKGIYQYLLNEFAKNIPKEFKFINREPDIGIPGLKKAKESYYPARMIDTFRIRGR
jgi:hypothetical protein